MTDLRNDQWRAREGTYPDETMTPTDTTPTATDALRAALERLLDVAVRP